MTVRPRDGFGAFVAASILAHAAIVAGLLLLIWFGRSKPVLVASFELVGIPGRPEGSLGAPKGGSATAAEQGGAEAPASQEEPPPAAEPDPISVPTKAKAPATVRQPLNPPGKVVANSGTAKAPGKTSATPGHGDAGGKGFLNGKGGTGTDTLEVGTGGGGGGAPSYMSSWLARVRQLVERQWRNVPSNQTPQGAPVVVFVVARDGRPGRPSLAHASGNPLVDRWALRAVQAVDAFPPPPQAWPKEEVKLRYVLEVHTP